MQPITENSSQYWGGNGTQGHRRGGHWRDEYSGGRGSALGVLPGAFLVSLLYNILILTGASSYWQNIFVGALILVAMIVDVIFDKLRGTRK